MNLFRPYDDPVKSALCLADRHVVKMTLETAQILCTVVHVSGAMDLDRPGIHEVYRPTHRNHPCVVWAGTTAAAARWCIEHGYALADEYTHRFGRVHKSAAVIKACERLLEGVLPPGDAPPPAVVVPDELAVLAPCAAYRATLAGKYAEWEHLGRPPQWTNSHRPRWASW